MQSFKTQHTTPEPSTISVESIRQLMKTKPPIREKKKTFFNPMTAEKFEPSFFTEIFRKIVGEIVADTTGNPMTTLAVAAQIVFPDDQRKRDAAMIRITALHHLSTDPEFSQWIQTSEQPGNLVIHPELIGACGWASLNESGEFKKAKVLEILKEVK